MKEKLLELANNMQKPKVYIVQKAYLKANTKAKLPGSYDVRTTIALIEYKISDGIRYMVIDSCQTVNWNEIKNNILKIAKDFSLVTHLLLTHTHMDHIQNISEFNNKLLFLANKTSLLGDHEYGSQEIYQEGQIEIPEIKYEIFKDAHSHDDTIYIIDSVDGKICFLGDLIYTRLEIMSVEQLIKMEERASVNPLKKFLSIKKILTDYQDTKKFYCGHDPEALTYQDLEKYYQDLLVNKKWLDFLNHWTKDHQLEQNKLLTQL